MKKAKFTMLTVLLLVTFCFNAYAYTYNGIGRWDSGDVRYAISVNTPSDYVNPTVWAAEMWTNNSNYNLTRDNSSQINVYAYNYGVTGWDGITYINGQNSLPIDDPYSYANIQINRTYADEYDDLRKKLVICHEFGHTASLYHVEEYTMMYGYDVWTAYQNNNSLRYSPAQDDIDGVNRRY